MNSIIISSSGGEPAAAYFLGPEFLMLGGPYKRVKEPLGGMIRGALATGGTGQAQLSPVKSMLPQARVSVKIWGKIDPA